jgi:hypothetical protein
MEAEEPIAEVKTLEQLKMERIQQVRFMAPNRPCIRASVPSRVMLNAKAKEIQMRLSEQGKYVTWQEIIYELINMYEGCENIGDLGLFQVDHLTAINDLLRLQKRIDIVREYFPFYFYFILLIRLILNSILNKLY